MKKIIIGLLFIGLCVLGFYIYKNYTEEIEQRKQEKLILKQQQQLMNVKKHYNKYVKTNKITELYELKDNRYKLIGSVNKDVILALKENIEIDFETRYFPLMNTNYYINYQDVDKTDKIVTDDSYLNYIVFNQNVITKDITNLYNDKGLVYTINESLSFPIIIKDTDKYYIEYDKQLLYVKKDEIKEIISSNNTNKETTSGIRALVYHAFYDKDKNDICTNTIICHEKKIFNEQMKYLYDNDYYAVTMKDLELFIDNKIRLPKNSIAITIDDGGQNIENIAIPILEQYKLHATLFLINGIYNKNDYISDYIEIHSHTYNMHKNGVCPGGQGSALKCLDKKTLLEDLKKSREDLNNTTVFCYPFYEYNNYTIEVLKEAGFTMAFANIGYKIVPGADKMTLSRYTILSDLTFNEYKEMLK